MREYVCVFGTPGNEIPFLREQITRCKDCTCFEPAVSDVATDWCTLEGGRSTTPHDFCSLAKTDGEEDDR
jgi:hypothetical protein